MAKDKKGFVLYADQKEIFDELPNDYAGKLIKHIFSYVNDENPTTDDLVLKIAFSSIKAQLKRDLKKYEAKSLKNSENANKRWHPNASERIPINANDADIDKDIGIDTVKVKGKDKRIEDFRSKILEFSDKYSESMISEFVDYWCESGEKDLKLRFEKQTSFGISRRLATWFKKSKEYGTTKTDNKSVNANWPEDTKTGLSSF
jgi:hypothetical protein